MTDPEARAALREKAKFEAILARIVALATPASDGDDPADPWERLAARLVLFETGDGDLSIDAIVDVTRRELAALEAGSTDEVRRDERLRKAAEALLEEVYVVIGEDEPPEWLKPFASELRVALTDKPSGGSDV